jgi:hypothetical protein
VGLGYDEHRRRGGGKFCVNRLASRCQRLWVEDNGMHGVSDVVVVVAVVIIRRVIVMMVGCVSCGDDAA